MTLDVRTIPAFRAIYVELKRRADGDFPAAVGEAHGVLNAYVEQNGLATRIGDLFSMIPDALQMPVPERGRYWAGRVIVDAAPLPASPAVHELSVPAQRVAVYTLIGSYEGLGAAWGKVLGELMPESQLEPSGEALYEVYLDARVWAHPDEPVTQIRVPVKS